jgi:hypothetical protein
MMLRLASTVPNSKQTAEVQKIIKMKSATLDKYKPLIMTDTFELRFEHKINWSYGECQLQDYLSTFLKKKKNTC